jgi:hypothetical protein
VELVGLIEQERQESYDLTGKESLSVDFSSNMRLMRDKTDVFDKDTQIVKGGKMQSDCKEKGKIPCNSRSPGKSCLQSSKAISSISASQ